MDWNYVPLIVAHTVGCVIHHPVIIKATVDSSMVLGPSVATTIGALGGVNPGAALVGCVVRKQIISFGSLRRCRESLHQSKLATALSRTLSLS
jgi:hypothetical protein